MPEAKYNVMMDTAHTKALLTHYPPTELKHSLAMPLNFTVSFSDTYIRLKYQIESTFV